MELSRGQVAVVTGAASGIGLALAERFAGAGLDVVLADVEAAALGEAAERVAAAGVATHPVVVDVSSEEDVQRLAAEAIERFGAVHVVCNNAGVASPADPWFGPLASWQWVMGVNFWGVVHGCRAFLPHLVGGGHIVNTASMAGLIPATGPSYDASKHAVVALTEDLFLAMQTAGVPVGVSVLCPGWVRTRIVDADRNWPTALGERPPEDPASSVLRPLVRRAIDEGATPAAVADAVVASVRAGRFWILPQPEFLDPIVRRWHAIAELADPQPEDVPGMPPREQIIADVRRALGLGPVP